VGVKPGYVEVVVEMVTEDEDEVDGVVVILTVMGVFKVFSNNGQPTPSVWQLTRM